MYENAQRVMETLDSLQMYGTFKMLIDKRSDYESKVVSLSDVLDNMREYIDKMMMKEDLLAHRIQAHPRSGFRPVLLSCPASLSETLCVCVFLA